MKIWIDADACPRVIKDIVFRAVERVGIEACLVAHIEMPAPDSPRVSVVQVPKGIDAADEYIAREAAADDIVITADVPLAAEVVRKGAVAIDPRGDLYDASTIADRLPFRNLMQDLRSTGAIEGGGPPPFNQTDRRRFGSALDRLLTRKLKAKS